MISYNRQRAMKAREHASATSVVEHRQHYLRLAFQYDAIADLEKRSPGSSPNRPGLSEDRTCGSRCPMSAAFTSGPITRPTSTP